MKVQYIDIGGMDMRYHTWCGVKSSHEFIDIEKGRIGAGDIQIYFDICDSLGTDYLIGQTSGTSF